MREIDSVALGAPNSGPERGESKTPARAAQSEAPEGIDRTRFDVAVAKCQLPLLGGLAGHNYVALLDSQARAWDQFHGLATSSDGRIKPIGDRFSDRLLAYSSRRSGWSLNKPSNRRLVLGFATAQGARLIEAALLEAAQRINALNLPYPLWGLGKNSNSMCATLLFCLGLPNPVLGDALTPGEGKILAPRSAFPTPPVIDALRRQNLFVDADLPRGVWLRAPDFPR